MPVTWNRLLFSGKLFFKMNFWALFIRKIYFKITLKAFILRHKKNWSQIDEKLSMMIRVGLERWGGGGENVPLFQ